MYILLDSTSLMYILLDSTSLMYILLDSTSLMYILLDSACLMRKEVHADSDEEKEAILEEENIQLIKVGCERFVVHGNLLKCTDFNNLKLILQQIQSH